MIEAQVTHHLKNQTLLEPFLARYANQLAIFNQEAPADTDPLWNPESQYGRIVIYIDMQDDPQRQISGTMGVDIYCEDGKQIPEEVEPVLRPLIDGYFFSSEEVTISAQWRGTQYFTEPTKKVCGATLTFDLMAFPKQETVEPDPIRLLNKWTGSELVELAKLEAVRVIGQDTLSEAWQATNEIPAIYWRLGNIRKCDWIPDTFNCSWETATLHGHIIVPDGDTATEIARCIKNTLTLKKRLIFEDEAPLMLDRNIQIAPANDPLRTGQITIEGTYGILNIPSQEQKLTHIYKR